MKRSWKTGLVALICSRECTAFVPVRPLGYSLSPAGGQALRGRQPVVAASIFDVLGGEPSYTGGSGTQWLKPGAWVFVKDLNQPAQVLSVQGDGTCVLQVPTRPSPMLVKRNVRDLLLADPRRTTTTPSAPPQDADTDAVGETAEDAQAAYRLMRDPRTGRMYVVSEPRPQLPRNTQGGRRMRIAPSRERLAGLGGPMAGGGKRSLLPGWDFVEDTFRRASEQEQQQPQPLLQQLVDAPRGAQETDDVDALRQLAKAYMLNDQPQEAASKLRQAYERDRSRFDDEALGDLAKAQHREGRLKDAMKTYRQALAQNAENAKVLLNYGISLHDSGNPAAAIPYYQKAVQLDDASVAAWNNLGIALQELGQVEPALQCYKRALEIDGLYSPALQNIAALTVAQGRFKMALACIQRALLLDPEDRTARRLAVEVMQRMKAGRLFPQLPSVVDRAAWKEQGMQEGIDEGRKAEAETISSEEEVPAQVEQQPVGVMNSDDVGLDEDVDSAAAEPERAEERQAMTWNDLLEKAWTTREALQRKAAEAAATLAREEEEKLRREYEMAMERRRQAEEKIRRLYGLQSADEDASRVAEAPSESVTAEEGLLDGGRPVVSPRDMSIEVTAEAVSPQDEVELVPVERSVRLQPEEEQEDARMYPRPKAQGVPGATKASAARAADDFMSGASPREELATVGLPSEGVRVEGTPSLQQQQQPLDDVNVYSRPKAQGVPGATRASAARSAVESVSDGSQGVEEQAPIELTWDDLLQALAGQPVPRKEAVTPDQQVIIRPQMEERPSAQTRLEAVSSREQEERPSVAGAQGRPPQDGRSMAFNLNPSPQTLEPKAEMAGTVVPQGTAAPGHVAEETAVAPETVSAEEDETTLQRQQLEANVDVWEQLRRAAWTEAREKQKIQGQMKAIEEYREKLKRQRIEAAERARLDVDHAAQQARARQIQLELEEKKALEAARLAKAVQEKALEEEKRMKAQVEQDRAAAVRRAWEEQTQAQLLEEQQARKALEERRQEAVRRAVESERMYLEQERQRRQLAEEEVRQRAHAARVARQREQLEMQRRWEEWRAKERERQRLQWEERERAVEERRRRVQRGLGLEAAESSDTGVAFDEAQELRSAAPPASARAVPVNEIFVGKQKPEADMEPGTAIEKVGIPFFITREMRRTLIEDLNYSHKEVNQMKPEVAREIIERGVKKPAKNFGRRGTTAGQPLPQSGGSLQADIDTRPTELIQQ